MDDGCSDAQDCGRDDGGLTEAVAPAHGNNAEDADGQVGDADLELEGIPGRPADGLGDRVRDEDVTEEPTDSAPATPTPNRYSRKISKRRSWRRLLLSRPRWPTAMTTGKTEKAKTRIPTLSMRSPHRATSAGCFRAR
jgi:hypothetical protein